MVRAFAGCYGRTGLPEGVTTDQEAEAYTAARAQQLRLHCCLVWSRRLSVYFTIDGTVEIHIEPPDGMPIRLMFLEPHRDPDDR